ncbi:hypothetical protein P7L68_00180 (plasmid) [Tistrella mobilis]|uniref:hypothetical protein n=1 Tax=Tistrella mobilis TaxID=171437 RepID=UPI003556A3F9
MTNITRREATIGIMSALPVLGMTGCASVTHLGNIFGHSFLASIFTAEKNRSIIRVARDFIVESLFDYAIEQGMAWMSENVLNREAERLGVSAEAYTKTAKLLGPKKLSDSIEGGYTLWYASSDRFPYVNNVLTVIIKNNTRDSQSGSFTFSCIDQENKNDIYFTETTPGVAIDPGGVHYYTMEIQGFARPGKKVFRIDDQPLYQRLELVTPSIEVLPAVVRAA